MALSSASGVMANAGTQGDNAGAMGGNPNSGGATAAGSGAVTANSTAGTTTNPGAGATGAQGMGNSQTAQGSTGAANSGVATGANGAPAPGTVVAQQGHVQIKTTSIPGVLVETNSDGRPFSNASGALLGASQNVHLDGGTRVELAIADASAKPGNK